ncbi:cysteine desulfurase family protein [Melissococcus plutonius]|uniref:cysteine desulfurase n=1 Tax=Melissococcus plutonius TaxID=33970 RepID=A0A2Z5Y315_9ENTE|nr:cysteine desulfurase family protein [Melissococcus plutonius]BAL62297.1 cysteine desulfurase [Melissococcus plutonius DAT561]MCV2498070.1 cysteine desulfurase [Melissococcus plutonius]MCV2500885.1 cysteine desulfurase [Melissococcus plutonius]MCV2504377.1 cysteine desulfurase [Melissococcus plutonius]MCV2506685.1 cysteine desulfurase [Melissococcus plutonius]
MNDIYLDHAATTPLHPAVIDKMTQEMNETFGNPSSIHSFGRKAHKKLEQARQLIAQSLQVNPEEIIFNSGGTEGANTAIIETALSHKAIGKHIITTMIEHPAVLKTMNYLEKLGYEITYLPVDSAGNLTVSDFKAALRKDTILVSIMYGNNEVGTLMPIQKIGDILTDSSTIFHTDAVQAYGHETILPKKLGIDLLSVSAHKINGPKGVGFLYKDKQVALPPLLHGGSQEDRRRAGTENIPGIIGIGQAISLLTQEEQQKRKNSYQAFQQQILEQLDQAAIAYQINGDPQNKLAHILNLWFPGIPSHLLVTYLDLNGIAVSAGSACSSGNTQPSHVFEAMYGKEHPANTESIRISFGLNNQLSDIKLMTEILIASIKKIKAKK